MDTFPDRPLWQRGACEMAAGYRSGAFTPVDVLAALDARIARINPRLNALIHRNAQAAAQAAASAERFRAGKPLGPLDGIALSIKDNLLTRGMPTTWGSAALRGHQPDAEEVAVSRAVAAGAVILGKTNVPEFTLEGYTANATFGVTRNPWNPALTPGGSSGGAVAGLAAGLFPLALGTDGGGSIRRPASHAGVVGLKPSIGAIARVESLPLLLLDFEVVGPMARTVDDVRLLFEAVRGPDRRDRKSIWRPPAAPPRPLRILYVPRVEGAPVDPRIASSVAAAARALQALGHRVDEGALPLDLGALAEDWPLIGQTGLAWMFGRDADLGARAGARYRQMAESGAAVPATKLWDIVQRVERLRGACAELFERVDVVMTPAAAALPWPAEEPYPPVIDGQPVGPRGHAVFTAWVNASGHPALALPSAPSACGLPIGFQLVADFGQDDLLLDLGRRYERLAPWGGRWPDLG